MTVTNSDASRSFFVFVQDKNTGKISRMAIPTDTQIGTIANPAELHVTGRSSLSTKSYNVASPSAAVYVDNHVTIVNVSSPTSAIGTVVTVYVPANPRDGQICVIKDASGTANINNITVTTVGGSTGVTGAATIDGTATQNITTAFGSLVLYWSNSQWFLLAAGVGTASSGSAGAPTDAVYVTLKTNVTLTNERVLTVSGSNITMTDAGANSTVSLDLSTTAVTPGNYNNPSITVDSFGRITAASNGVAASNGWIDGGNKMKTTGSISIDASSNYANAIGTDVFFYVSGSRGVVSGSSTNRKVSVFGGDVVVSGGYYSNTASVLPDEQSIFTGTYATRPPASIKGRIYLPTDAPSIFFRDDGTTWIPYGPTWRLTTPPLSASFSGTINLGGASFTDFSGSLILSGVVGAGTNQRAALISVPSVPYKLTVMFKQWVSLSATGTATAGLCWREGSSGKMVSFTRYLNTTTLLGRMQVSKYTNATTFSAAYIDQPMILSEHNWFRIEETSLSRICSYSVDGINFYPVHSVGRADFLTADSIGIVIEPTALNSIMSVLSWKVE